MSKPMDHTDKKYSHLQLIAYLRPGGKGRGAIWVAKCDCGNVREVVAKYAVAGKIKSCGKCQYSRNLMERRQGIKMTADRYSFLSQFRRATAEGVEWKITTEEYKKLIQDDCALCGEEYQTVAHKITRIDFNKDYTTSNVVPLCKECWKLKRTSSFNSLLDLVRRICAHVFPTPPTK